MIKYSKDVLKALKENKPIVALESTIITHGLPYPINLEMATNVEKLVRLEGATPATIAIIDGVIRVGLEEEDLIALAKTTALKASRSDLSFIVSQKKTAGTTVALTMLIAKMASIKVFATGGIGGVHKDYDDTLDVSADLEELSRSDVCVVCAGPKAILDLPKTVEYLETKGVPVIGYQTDELPSFYSRTSGVHLSLRLDTPQEIAALIKTQEKLSIHSGILVVNPIPTFAQMDEAVIKEYIDVALLSAKAKNIKGKEVTPYLLSALEKHSKGETLKANLELVYNNAKLAGKISKSLCML